MTNYPSNKQTFTNTSATEEVSNTGGIGHAETHNLEEDTIEALQDKVGTGASTPTPNTVLKGDGSGTSTWQNTTGQDNNIVSGTSGSDTEFAQWNSDGDLATNSLTPSGSDTSVITGTVGTENRAVAFNADGDLVANTTPEVTGLHDTNGNEFLTLSSTASAVNHIDITNSATGNDPLLSPKGDDTNVGLKIKGKGTGQVQLGDAEVSFPDNAGSNGQFLQSDGSGGSTWANESSTVDQQEFTSDGTWNKPSAGVYVLVEAWGAGGSGGTSDGTQTVGSGGGGGGLYTWRYIPLSVLGTTETVTVGTGGGSVSSAGDGNDGGNSSFGSHVVANGGKGGNGFNNNADITPGGSMNGLGTPLFGDDGDGFYSGAGADVVSDVAQSAYTSVYGGAGGGGYGPSGGGTAGAQSTYGGDGGAGSNTTGSAGSAPGGGGGAGDDSSGAGGDGKVRVTVI